MLCANLALNYLYLTSTPTLRQLAARRDRFKVPSLDYSAEANFGGISLAGVTVGETVGVTHASIFPQIACPPARQNRCRGGEWRRTYCSARDGLSCNIVLFYMSKTTGGRIPERLIREIDALGYDMWWHLTPLFNPGNICSITAIIFLETLFSNIQNMVCAPKEKPLSIERIEKNIGRRRFSAMSGYFLDAPVRRVNPRLCRKIPDLDLHSAF